MQSDHTTRVNDDADFWAPDPPSGRWGPMPRGTARRGRSRAVLAALTLAATLALPLSPASAALPREPENMSTLRERAEALKEEYNGELRDMEAVMEEADRAEARAEATREEVEAAREQVRHLAIAAYTGSGIDPAMALFVEADPEEIIDRAVLIERLSSSNQDKVDQLLQAHSRNQAAQENAEEKLAEAEEDLDALEDRRAEVHRMIADHPSQPQGGRYNLTPRTEQMRELVIEEFGEGRDVGGVGCYRPVGGWIVGEHPFGRACDFMLSGNGTMPSQEQIDRGWAIAEWARENADDLGVMYVIYRQQIWDVRRGDTDWRAMSDRGSITENHFDHVHISMF